MRESVRLRGLFKEERRTLEKELAQSDQELKAKADIQAAQDSYDTEDEALEERHQALTEDLRKRLVTLRG